MSSTYSGNRTVWRSSVFPNKISVFEYSCSGNTSKHLSNTVKFTVHDFLIQAKVWSWLWWFFKKNSRTSHFRIFCVARRPKKLGCLRIFYIERVVYDKFKAHLVIILRYLHCKGFEESLLVGETYLGYVFSIIKYHPKPIS